MKKRWKRCMALIMAAVMATAVVGCGSGDNKDSGTQRKYNTAIFVHGCFWHRHEGCKYAYMPRSRVEFWQKKFDANIKRDECVRKELMRKKVKVVIVWECTIKKMKKDEEFREDKLHQLEDYLQNEQYSLEI